MRKSIGEFDLLSILAEERVSKDTWGDPLLESALTGVRVYEHWGNPIPSTRPYLVSYGSVVTVCESKKEMEYVIMRLALGHS